MLGRQRFFFEDVNRGSRYGARLQRLDQGWLVDNRPARRVDQSGRLLFSLENVSQTPPSAQRSQFDQISSFVNGKVSEVKTLIDTNLRKLDEAMKKPNIPYIPPPSPK